MPNHLNESRQAGWLICYVPKHIGKAKIMSKLVKKTLTGIHRGAGAQ